MLVWLFCNNLLLHKICFRKDSVYYNQQLEVIDCKNHCSKIDKQLNHRWSCNADKDVLYHILRYGRILPQHHVSYVVAHCLDCTIVLSRSVDRGRVTRAPRRPRDLRAPPLAAAVTQGKGVCSKSPTDIKDKLHQLTANHTLCWD